MLITDEFIYFHESESTAKELDATYIKSKGMYRLPLTLGVVRDLYKINQSEKLLELGKKLRKDYEHALKLKKLPDAEGDRSLRPYQRVDIAFLKTLEHKGIFNQQRTGKTPTTLKLLESEGHKRVVIVCPASLKMNWSEEIEKWLNKDSFVIGGTPTQRQQLYGQFNLSDEAILIISYETLRNDLDYITPKIDALVLDEAHRIRNTKTKQTKAVMKLGRLARTRIAITGTPAVNHASDVFGLLQFLYPKKFPSYWQFIDRYFQVKDGFFGKDIGKFKRQAELEEVLQALSTNRKRDEVMNWLPNVTHQTIKLEADKVQLSAYKQMLDTFEVEEDGVLKVDAPSPLAQLMRLRQITLDPSLLDLKGKSPKLDFILDYISDNPNEPIIIFSCFTSFLKTAATKIGDHSMIIGEQSAQEKQDNVRKFQQGKTNVLLANIISGGTGFTIDRAETIIYLDKSFSPIDNEQSADRFIPTKEDHNATKRTIIDLVIKGTVDEKIDKLLKEKKSIVDLVNTYGIGVILD